jgi:hypothetical protein
MGNLTAGARPSPRAPRRARFFMWRSSAPTGAQSCATAQPAPERRSAPARPSAGLTPSARRADPACPRFRQRARDPGGQARLLRVDRPASTAGPLANAATAAGRSGPPGGPGGDQAARVAGPMRPGFAQVTGHQRRISVWSPVSCQQPRRGKTPDRTHVRRPDRPPLLYFAAVLALRLFEFRF